MSAEQLITKHLDIWTSAHKTRSSAGRGSSSKLDLYGIKKLRELILELAVRGKLVPQDPNDEPASELLKKIAAEKIKLIKDKKIKKEKIISNTENKDELLELPNGWVRAYLQNICSYIQRGKGPVYAENGKVRVVSQKCVRWDAFDLEHARYVSDNSLAAYGEERYLCDNDLLWNSTGTGTVGRIIALKNIAPSTLVADSHVTVLRPLCIDSKYLSICLSSPNIQKRMEPGLENSLVSGTTNQVELNTSSVMSIQILIPPLAEQDRLVAKVGELMAFCDELEQAETENISAHVNLVEALLSTLTNSKDHQELQANWLRIAEHFDTLFTTEDSIDRLKQTILQLAVMGKLVPQDPNDEPASELLKKIAAEKAQLIKEGKIKKDKPLPETTENKKKFEIPKGWELTYLQNVCSLITDGTHQTPKYTNDGRPFISAQCVKPFRFMPENCRYVSEEHYQNYIKNRKPEYGDVLLSRVGAGIGEACVINLNMDFAIYVSTALIKPIFLMPEFLTLWLNSPAGRVFSAENTLGKGVSQGNLNLSLIRAFKIPVPPIEEQKRIIAKIDELINLCDKLIDDIKYGKYIQFFLADALASDSIVF